MMFNWYYQFSSFFCWEWVFSFFLFSFFALLGSRDLIQMVVFVLLAQAIGHSCLRHDMQSWSTSALRKDKAHSWGLLTLHAQRENPAHALQSLVGLVRYPWLLSSCCTPLKCVAVCISVASSNWSAAWKALVEDLPLQFPYHQMCLFSPWVVRRIYCGLSLWADASCLCILLWCVMLWLPNFHLTSTTTFLPSLSMSSTMPMLLMNVMSS